MLVISAGLYKETRIQTLIQALIIVIGGVALAPFFGLAGILIASCLSNLYRVIDLMFFIPKNVTKIPVIETAKRMFMVLLDMVIIVLPCVLLIDINASSYLQWAFYACGVTAYSIIVVLIIGAIFDRKLLKSVFIRIKNMIMRKEKA